jgi:TrmH family RNA methyltransferase
MTHRMPQKPLKWYRELADKKSRTSAGAFLVEGEKAIRQIIVNRPEAVMEILSIGEPPLELRRFPGRLVTAAQFQYISQNKTPQGLAAVVKIPSDTYSSRPPDDAGGKILLLEDIQDPGNAGTLMRTAAACDFSGVILSDRCADPFSPKVVQASAGAVMSVWVRVSAQYLEIARALQSQGYVFIAATLEGSDSPDVLTGSRLVLALGNEAAGLSAALVSEADCRVAIPIARDKAESLNAAVCGGIMMYLSVPKKVP